MELAVLNTQGKETGRNVVLSDAVFGVEANDHAIYLDVKQYLADQRQGTHKSKQRNEVAGSTRKLKRQKGTGGARCGSIKSPLFVGGGRVFGPVPRDYSFKLNKKLKQLARRSALTYKAQAGAICVVEPISMDAPKTKSIVAMAEALKVASMAAGRTGLVCAGGSTVDAKTFLTQLYDQIHVGGACGNATGRNIHQRSLDEAVRLTKAISAITLADYSVADALAVFNGEKDFSL